MYVQKGGLAPGFSIPGLNLIQPVGCLSPFPDSHPSKARHFKIGGIPAAPRVAGGLQIAANHGARHAELVGELLLGESGEIYCPREEMADAGVPALAGIRAKEPPKGGAPAANFQPRAVCNCQRPPSPFGRRLASASFLGTVVLPFG